MKNILYFILFSYSIQLITREYDLFIIGGGPGGLSAAKQAAKYKIKVGLADFVEPSPLGSKWLFGGTCFNVGCIPKIMMHHISKLSDEIKKLNIFEVNQDKENIWTKVILKLIKAKKMIKYDFMKGLENIHIYNAYATLIDKNTINLSISRNNNVRIIAKKIIISIGGRPNYRDIPGSKEFTITSDDFFFRKNSPGNTLIIGSSYIGAETAGLINSLGFNVTILVKSKFLNNFDKEMANKVKTFMSKRGVNFINEANVISFSEKDKKKIITYEINGKQYSEKYDTIVLAIGRVVNSKKINADKIGINIAENGKIIVKENDETNISNIYAIGDCADGRIELAPATIMSARLLIDRLYNNSNELMNYENMPSALFTPYEYGFVGLSEEEALKKYGKEKIDIYSKEFEMVENNLKENSEKGYIKVITNKLTNVIIGFHIFSPNAGEITQVISMGMKSNITIKEIQSSIGIHPTIAEVLIELEKL